MKVNNFKLKQKKKMEKSHRKSITKRKISVIKSGNRQSKINSFDSIFFLFEQKRQFSFIDVVPIQI